MITPGQIGSEVARDALRDHILIGYAHVQLNQDGQLESIKSGAPVLTIDTGTILQEQAASERAALANEVLTTVRAIFSDNLGAFGQFMTWRIFSPAELKACGDGQLIVEYAGVAYDFVTPIPGCPSA